ncbi:DUF2703 domain-containing protein [Thermovirga lienii]|jgi:hypothetical protein|uniref:DUF2703 domain-containing protein n=1 Tax=Thermovirga lienii TaxID=336261 RepID=UPI000ED3CB6F|nr:hypothetical protein [Thermovirga lienii]
MNKIIIRHYSATAPRCQPVDQTIDTLQKVVSEMNPKLENIGFNLELELIRDDKCKVEDINKVTLSCQEMDFEETPLEEIIGVPVDMELCPCQESSGECRALVVEGKAFQSLPPGLILDGILRVAFSALEQLGGGCGHSCDGCHGCGG